MSENENKELKLTDDMIEAEEVEASEPKGEETAPDSAQTAKKPFSEALEWVSSLVYAVLVMLALNIFVFRSITVDGESMNDTLQHRDNVIAFNLFYTPQRGDIVVLQADRLSQAKAVGGDKVKIYGEPIIKRVIAIEGDTIEFDFEKGEVYLNGELLQEDYIKELTVTAESRESGVKYVVPEGCVFVMGDNRNNSTDSRDYRVGMVDADLIMGKAVFRYAPFDKIGLL